MPHTTLTTSLRPAFTIWMSKPMSGYLQDMMHIWQAVKHATIQTSSMDTLCPSQAQDIKHMTIDYLAPSLVWRYRTPSWWEQDPPVWCWPSYHPCTMKMSHYNETSCKCKTWKSGMHGHKYRGWRPKRLGFNMYLTWKANGNLWVCLDQSYLNTAICWDHHRTPTVAEVVHESLVYSNSLRLT